MKNLFFIFTLILFVFSSCSPWQHKYPEDTERTKLTPTERLTGKTWTLANTTFNGVDYTDSINNYIGHYEIYFSSTKAYSMYSGFIKTDIEGEFGIVWRFSIGDKDIGIDRQMGMQNYIAPAPCYIRPLTSNNGNYIILKLSENEFKIKFTNTNQDTVIINQFIR